MLIQKKKEFENTNLLDDIPPSVTVKKASKRANVNTKKLVFILLLSNANLT